MYPFVGAVTLNVHAACPFPSYVYVPLLALALIVPLVTVAVNVLLHVA